MPQSHEPLAGAHNVDHIIGREPGWMIRWGTVLVFLVVLVLLTISWVVKYPTLVMARITITSQKPPVQVISRSSGKLEQIFVSQEQKVDLGEVLALVENTAHYPDVQTLQTYLEGFQAFLGDPYVSLGEQPPAGLRLGEMAGTYTRFLKQVLNWRSLVEQDFSTRRIEGLEKQLASFDELDEKLSTREALLEEEQAIAESKLKQRETLFKKGLVSEDDLQDSRSALLSKKILRANHNESMIRNRIEQQKLTKTMMELRQERDERHRQSLLEVREAMTLLQDDLKAWEQRYLLRAPANGIVSFYRFWSADQYVVKDEEVMTILPEDNQLVGKIFLPQEGAGRVATGQAVRIKLDSYPFEEFGILDGQVTTFAEVSREGTYLLDVSLPLGLETSYQKRLAFKYGMQGQAEIVTEEMRLIERFFNRFRRLVEGRI